MPNTAEAASPTSYRYRPARFGTVWQFRLTDDALLWEAGATKGGVRYADMCRIRLSFRPLTMQSHRFITEIWSKRHRKLKLASSSWRIVDHERHDGAYTAFVRELHRRLVVAGVPASFETGWSPLRYWPGVVVLAGVVLALAWLIARALASGLWSGAALTTGLLAVVLWQAGTFFLRNRPGTYRPEAPPRALLP